MKLTCPACGAVASAEAWENDMDARRAMQAIVGLPREVGIECFGYLSLFRPSQRALGWKAALRLVQELDALVASGHVQVQGKPARPAPAIVWAQAMRQMAAQRDSISRPMRNHNYLRQIVWQLADQADARRERQHEQDERSGAARAERQYERQEQVELSEAERETLRKLGLDTKFQQMQELMTRR